MTRTPEHSVAMTPRMVAERWECSERHVRNLLEQGLLPYFRLGGKLIRILREDVAEFERRGGTEQEPEAETVPEPPPEAGVTKRPRAKRLDIYPASTRFRGR